MYVTLCHLYSMLIKCNPIDKITRRVFNSMVYGSADPCFALSDKKIKLHILSNPKNKIGISEIFHSRLSR